MWRTVSLRLTLPGMAFLPSKRPAPSIRGYVCLPQNSPISGPIALHEDIENAQSIPRIASLFQSSQNFQTYLSHPLNVQAIVISLAQANKNLLAQRTTAALELAGYTVTPRTFGSLCHHAAVAKEWDHLYSSTQLALKVPKAVNKKLLNWHILAAFKTGRYASLDAALRLFKTNGIPPDRRTFHLLLSGYLRNCDLDKAKRCLKQMAHAGFPPDASTQARIAIAYRYLGPNPATQTNTLAQLGHISSSDPSLATAALNSLINMRLKLGDLYGVLELLLLFDNYYISPVFDFVAARLPSDAHKPMHPPVDGISPLVPDASTFSMFLLYLSKQKDWASGRLLIHHIKVLGIIPNEHLLTSLITFLTSSGDIANPCQLVLSMKRPPVLPILQRLAANATGPVLLDVRHLFVTAKVLNALLSGLSSRTFFRDALSAMKKSPSHTPNQQTLEVIARRFTTEKKGHPYFFATLRMMHQFSFPDTSPVTLSQVNLIMAAQLRQEKLRLVRHGWRCMDRSWDKFRPLGRKGTYWAPSTALDPLGGVEISGGRQRKPMDVILTTLRKNRTRSNPASFLFSLRHHALIRGDMTSANNVFREMLDRGIHPAPHHFAVLMEGYAYLDNMEAAEAIVNSAKEFGILPNAVMYTILLVGYGRKGQPEGALRVFHEMIRNSIRPDLPSLDALVGSFTRAGAHTTAKRILLTFWPQIRPLPENVDASMPLHVLLQILRAGGQEISGRAPDVEERQLTLRKIREFMAEWRSWAKPEQLPIVVDTVQKEGSTPG